MKAFIMCEDGPKQVEVLDGPIHVAGFWFFMHRGNNGQFKVSNMETGQGLCPGVLSDIASFMKSHNVTEKALIARIEAVRDDMMFAKTDYPLNPIPEATNASN